MGFSPSDVKQGKGLAGHGEPYAEAMHYATITTIIIQSIAGHLTCPDDHNDLSRGLLGHGFLAWG